MHVSTLEHSLLTSAGEEKELETSGMTCSSDSSTTGTERRVRSLWSGIGGEVGQSLEGLGIYWLRRLEFET